jgi:hypothetical protein
MAVPAMAAAVARIAPLMVNKNVKILQIFKECPLNE